MRKYLILLLLLVMAVVVFSACSRKEEASVPPPPAAEEAMADQPQNIVDLLKAGTATFVIQGYDITLSMKKSDEHGFLIFEFNIETDRFLGFSSAVLTVEESDTPIYIEQRRGDISKNVDNKYRLSFATNQTPANLYLKMWSVEEVAFDQGKKRVQKQTWHHLDLKNGQTVMLEEPPFEELSVFDANKLKNAADSIKSDIRKFKPSDPQPMHFVVYANTVIDPMTRRASQGGRTDT
ncbi:MAG: hypothetical protein FWH25_05200, partial [Syntrophorhabdaceae bacterium]|nr:hypothetical protein [Syntrophorhabdaceae bacterium]